MFPKTSSNPTNQNPRKLIVMGHTKVGKSQSLASLPNCLVLDLDNSMEFYGGMYINLQKMKADLSIEKGKEITLLQTYLLICNQLRKGTLAKELSYDYIAIDNLTVLEELAKELALIKYKTTPMGKAFQGDDIYTLPNGAGYGHTRNAFKELYDNELLGTYNKTLILVAHVKPGSIIKNGEELSALDLNVSGKMKLLVSADVDAIGYIYRDKGVNRISFKTDERQISVGSRCAHLSNKDLVFSTMVDGKLVTNWDEIFIIDSKLNESK